MAPKKRSHELKDPIHAFIRANSLERAVIDSPPLQRLRHIHQLSMAYLVYPGATHKRFEHSLGVMELAGRVFDSITSKENFPTYISDIFPELNGDNALPYWRQVLRLAALCHDVGHLPFSHAPEHLLPKGFTHEKITQAIIESNEFGEILRELPPPHPDPLHIVKLALGKKEAPDIDFSVWEALLSEVITGEAFGVDRMDYLLRDAHHTGVPYGVFDHYRLIDTLRILQPATDVDSDPSREPSLGVELGGLAAAEALLLSRYYMFRTVYFHPVNRIYRIHLSDYLEESRKGEPFPIDPQKHLLLTDNEVTAEILSSARDIGSPGHVHAKRIVERRHFKRLYEWSQADFRKNARCAEVVRDKAIAEFGSEHIRYDRLPGKGDPRTFLVQLRNGLSASAFSESRILADIPAQKGEYVFIDPDLAEKGRKWLNDNLHAVLEN